MKYRLAVFSLGLMLASSISAYAMEDLNETHSLVKNLKKDPPDEIGSNHTGSAVSEPLDIAIVQVDIHHKIISYIGNFYDLVNMTRTCSFWHTLLSEVIQNKVFLIGCTGTGKSTLVNLVKGIPLMAQRCYENDDEGDDLHLTALEELPTAHIGHGICAGTLKPMAICDFANKQVMIDCPGFGDPRGLEEEFKIAVKLYNLLKGKLSIIYVLDQRLFEMGDCPRYINKLTEIFPQQSELQNVISFVMRRMRKKTLIDELQYEVTHRNPNLSDRSYQLLQHLLTQPLKLVEFNEPTKVGPYPLPEEIKNFMQNLTFVVSPEVTAPLKNAIEYKRWSSTK